MSTREEMLARLNSASRSTAQTKREELIGRLNNAAAPVKTPEKSKAQIEEEAERRNYAAQMQHEGRNAYAENKPGRSVINGLLVGGVNALIDKKSGKSDTVKKMSATQRVGNTVGKTVTGGAKGYLGSETNALGAAYDAGQNYRTSAYNEQAEQYRKELAIAERDLEETKATLGKGSTEKDVEAAQNVVDYYNQLLSAYDTGLEAQRGAVKATYKLADTISEGGQKDVESAKNTAYGGKFGEMLVQAGASTVQSSIDALASMALVGTGTHTMAPFVIRSFGGGAQQARQEMEANGTADSEGALAKQIAYGVASAAKEYITEKAGGIGAGRISAGEAGYLDAFWDKVGDSFAGLITKSPVANTIISRLTSGFISEGAEEFVGDYLEYIFSLSDIYGGSADTLLKDAKDGGVTGVAKGLAGQLAAATEDFIIGGLSGVMGGTAEIAKGAYSTSREARQLYRYGDRDELVKAVVDTGLESESGTKSNEYAKYLQQRLQNGDKVSDYALGVAYNANVEAINEEERTAQEQQEAASEAPNGITPEEYSRLVREAQIEPESVSEKQTQNDTAEAVNVQETQTVRQAEPETQPVTESSPKETITGSEDAAKSAPVSSSEMRSSVPDARTQRNIQEAQIGIESAKSALATAETETEKDAAQRLLDYYTYELARFENRVASPRENGIMEDGSNVLPAEEQNGVLPTSEGYNGREQSSGGEGRRGSLAAAEQGQGLDGSETDGRDYQVGERNGTSAVQEDNRQRLYRAPAEVGVEKGVDAASDPAKTFSVIAEDDYNGDERSIVTYASAYGKTVHFYKGDLYVRDTPDGTPYRVRGLIHANGKDIWIKADHSKYSEAQIFMHEDFHAAVKDNPEVLKRGIEKVREKYKDDDAGLMRLLESYAHRYKIDRTKFSDDYILEEVLADAHAGIDVQTTDADGNTQTVDFSDIAEEVYSLREQGTAEKQGGTKSSKEESTNGEILGRRKETSGEFRERGREKEYRTAKIGNASYAYARAHSHETSLQSEIARRELKRLGIKSFIHKGLEVNVGGYTEALTDQANTIVRDVGISAKASIPGLEIAGHEAYHVWAETSPASRAIYDTVLQDGIDYTSADFALLVDSVMNSYEKASADDIGEEIFAYISGLLHSGENETLLHRMLADYDGVKSAWDQLVAANTQNGEENQTRFSMEEADAKYLSLAADPEKNKAELQQMVDEAAKEAGYDYHLYHGTNADFTVFDIRKNGGKNGKGEGYGIYLAANKEISSPYGNRLIDSYTRFKRLAEGEKRTLTTAEVKKIVRKSCELEAERNVNDGEYDTISDALLDTWVSNYVYTYEYSSMSRVYDDVTREILNLNSNDGDIINEIMLSAGAHYDYDSALDFYDNVLTPITGIDGFHYVWKSNDDSGIKNDIYLAFHSEQIKSADPVTYDDNGNVIPLSERFNQENEDIRFSREEDDDYYRLIRENERLRERVEYFKGQTQLSEPSANPIDVRKYSRQIVKDYDSTVKAEDIVDRVQALSDMMKQGGNDVQYEELKGVAVSIAKDVVQNASVLVNDEQAEFYYDIKNTLSKREILISRADAKDVTADYAEWRKHLPRYLHVKYAQSENGGNVDLVYSELQDMYPFLFGDMNSNGDKLRNIYDVMQTMAPIFDNPYSNDIADVIEYCANDILESTLDMRLAPPTFADKAKARLDAEKAANRAKIAEVKADAKERLDAQKKSDAWYYSQKMQEIRDKRDAQIKALKEHQAQINAARRSMRREADDRKKLLRIARTLQGKKISPATKAMLPDYLKILDTTAVNITGKSIRDLSALKEWYDAKTDPESKTYDPNFIPDKSILKKLDRLDKATKNGFTVGQLDIQTVREMTEVLQNILHQETEGRKFQNSKLRIDNYEAGLRVTDDINNAPRGDVSRELNPLRAVRQIVGYADGEIEGTTESPLITLTKEMISGGDRAKLFMRENRHRLEPWLKNKKFMRRIYGKNAKEIELVGVNTKDGNVVKVNITPAMRMSLYLHSMNEDNLRHICGYTTEDGKEVLGGGVTVPNLRLYKRGDMAAAYDASVNIRLTRDGLKRFVSEMPNDERGFADALWRYFNKCAPEALNKASVLIDGWEKFTLENYFPISVNKNFLQSDFDGIQLDENGSLTHPGFGEERIQSTKPIYLLDATDVFNRALETNAKYAFQAVPLMNMNKLLNVQQIGAVDSVQSALARQSVKTSKKGNARSSGALRGITISPADYLKNFMQDYAGAKRKRNGTLEGTLAKVRSNYSGAVLTLGAGTAIKQAASYPTAAAILSTRSLSEALLPKRIKTSFIDERTAAFTERKEGFSSVEQAELAQEGKHIPIALNWIQGVDVGTTWALKRACCIEVSRTVKTESTEEYEQAVTELYRRVIEETQPNYSVENRPDILRSNSALERALVMFATQPMQNYGILADAVGDFRAKAKAFHNDANAKSAYQASAKRLGKAIASQLVSSLVFALMQYGWDWFRKKDKKYKNDDGDVTFGSFAKGIGLNMLTNGAGMFIDGKAALELVEALSDAVIKKITGEKFFNQSIYGFEVAELEALTDAANSILKLVNKSADEESDAESVIRAATDVATGIATVKGIPAENAITLLKSLTKQIISNAAGKYVGEYYSMRIDYDPEVSTYRPYYYDLLYSASKSDREAYAEIYRLMTESGDFSEDGVTDAMQSRVKDDYEKGRITEEEAAARLVTGAGKAEEKAKQTVAKWKYAEWDTDGKGLSQDEISFALESGDYTKAEKESIWNEFGYKAEYADVQEKAAARVVLDENAVIYNSENWENGLTDISLPDKDKDTLVTAYGGTWFAEPYKGLRDAGYSPSEAYSLLTSMDADENHSIKQAEAFDVLRDMDDAYASALWDVFGWKTGYDEYKAKNK